MKAELGYVELTFVVRKDGNQYGSLCLELGTASFGETVEEAMENLEDAVIVHLNELESTGQRKRIFEERGIILRKHKARKRLVSIDKVPYDSIVSKHQVPLAIGAGG